MEENDSVLKGSESLEESQRDLKFYEWILVFGIFYVIKFRKYKTKRYTKLINSLAEKKEEQDASKLIYTDYEDNIKPKLEKEIKKLESKLSVECFFLNMKTILDKYGITSFTKLIKSLSSREDNSKLFDDFKIIENNLDSKAFNLIIE